MNIEGTLVLMLASLSLGLLGVIITYRREIDLVRRESQAKLEDLELLLRTCRTFPSAAKAELTRRALGLKELEMRVIGIQQKLGRPSGRRYLPYLENAQYLAHLQAEHEEAKAAFEASHRDFRKFRDFAVSLWGNKVWYGTSWKEFLPEEVLHA